jgi:hypothetical protein
VGPDQIAAGGVDGVSGPVVLAGLPDVRVGVVLAAIVDGYPNPEGEGNLPVLGGPLAAGIVLAIKPRELTVAPTA